MGKVYLARQHTLNRLVCVKVMSIPAGVDADSADLDFAARRNCWRASRILTFSRSSISARRPTSGLPYLVTEYIEGGDLRGRMKPGQAMPVSQARSIVSQVGDALSHLHEQGNPPSRPQARKHPDADRFAGQGGRLRHRRDARQGRGLDRIRSGHGDRRLCIARTAIRPEG